MDMRIQSLNINNYARVKPSEILNLSKEIGRIRETVPAPSLGVSAVLAVAHPELLAERPQAALKELLLAGDVLDKRLNTQTDWA